MATGSNPPERPAVPDTREINSKTNLVTEAANAMTIVDPEMYEEATGFLQDIKGLQNEINSTFDMPIKMAHEAHKAIIAARDRHRVPLIKAESLVKEKIGSYLALEEERRKADEEKLIAEAEQREADAREAEVKELEEEGKTEEAELVKSAPVLPPPVVLQPRAPKVKGISTRESWTFAIENETEIPREFLMPDLKKIRGVVRAMKKQTNIPGIRAYSTSTISARTK